MADVTHRRRPRRSLFNLGGPARVMPRPAYHAVTGMSVPVSVSSLDQAALFLDHMVSDVLQASKHQSEGRRVSLSRDEPPSMVSDYTEAYAGSLTDLTTQVNRLNLTPTFWERLVYRVRRDTVHHQLDTLVESLGEAIPRYYGSREIVSLLYDLNLDKDPFAARVQRERMAALRTLLGDEERGEERAVPDHILYGDGSTEEPPHTSFERIDLAKMARSEESPLSGLVPVRLVRLVRRILRIEETENAPSTAEEGTSTTPLEATKTETVFNDPYARYFLADSVVKSIARHVEAHQISVTHAHDYPEAVKEEIRDGNRRLAFRVAGRVLAASVAATLMLTVPAVVRYHTAQVEKRKKEVAVLEKELDRASLEQLMQQYTLKFNGVLDRLKDFKGKYWLDASTTANFYLCYKQTRPSGSATIGTALPPLERLSDLSVCLYDLGKRLQAAGGSFPATSTTANASLLAYLENAEGLFKLVLPEIAEIRELEAKIEKHYEGQLEKIEAFEKGKGYALDDTTRNTLAAKNAFERIREGLHLGFTVESSPVAFYALALGKIEGGRTIYRWNPSPTPGMLQAYDLVDTLAADVFTRYLAHESPQMINAAPYWQPGGDFDKATALAGKMHQYLAPATATSVPAAGTTTATTIPNDLNAPTVTTPTQTQTPDGGTTNGTGN